MPGHAEEMHELGRSGVSVIKRWLEATTYLEMPFDSYNHQLDCTVVHKSGRKVLDLAGYFVGTREPVFVESKRYSSEGGQYPELLELLAIAYSTALKDIEDLGAVKRRHFVWVTTHPFKLTRWKHLETHEEMRIALESHPGYLAGAEIDESLLREIADRVMVLVYNPKMDGLTLTRDELQNIRTVLDRKGASV